MPPYKPGNLDQRIRILRQTQTPDGSGGFDVTTAEVYSLAAKVRVKGGAEVFKYEKVEAPQIYVFTVRQGASLVVKQTDIIEWLGNQFNIRSPLIKNPRHMYLDIEAETGVAL